MADAENDGGERVWYCDGCGDWFPVDHIRGGKCKECRLDEIDPRHLHTGSNDA